MLIVMLIGGIILSYKAILLIMKSIMKQGFIRIILVAIDAALIIASIFLYFSAAWGHGILLTLVSFLFAITVSNPVILETYGYETLGIFVIWLGIFTGAFLSQGALQLVSTGACQAFYRTKSKTMCKEGWLTFLSIFVMVLVGINFLSLLILASQMIGAHKRQRPQS